MATMEACARPACELTSCTLGLTERMETTSVRMRLMVIAAWFMEHPDPAKNTYMTTVRTKLPTYMPRVDDTRIVFQSVESVSSIRSRQVSAHECAKSTRRTSPMSKKMTAPTVAK